MSATDPVLLLRRCSLWSDLTEEEYKELDVADNYKEVKKGQYVYFEAYHHNVIYFIKQGQILLGKIDDSGSVVTKDILRPGDFFGQFILEKTNLDGEFAQAIKSDISLCSFTIENFVRLLQRNPTLSLKFTKLVGWRLRKFENRLINIIQNDTRTRLLLFMQELLNDNLRGKSAPADTYSIPNYLTQDEIARLIGASRQTVTTLLVQLKEEGILEYDRHTLKFYSIARNFSRQLIQ